jgi:preprotein translocase subunit SecF
MALGILKTNIYVDFVKHSKKFFIFSTISVFLCFVALFVFKLNLGVDFKGGIVLDFRVKNLGSFSLDGLKTQLTQIKISDFVIKQFDNDGVQIVISIKDGQSKEVLENGIANIKNLMFDDYDYLQSQFVGPSISENLLIESITAVLLSFIGIFFYLWFRFDWQYGVIGVITLLHDVLLSFLFLAIFQYEVNVGTIAGVLTIIGYSINDTVVIFDQIRENIKKHIKQDVSFILNSSLSQVLSRSIATSLTVLLVLLSIFIFGGEALKSFSFTLLIGVIFGTYSSICLAAPMLKYLGDIKARAISDANKV